MMLTLAFGKVLYAQDIQYDIKIKYHVEVSGTLADIMVTVKSESREFIYYLMSNDPRKGEVLQKSEPTRKKNFTFRDVQPGKYFIKIENSMGMPFGKTVVVKDAVSSN